MDSKTANSTHQMLPKQGTSGYNQLTAKTKGYAHNLRKALSGALELKQSGKWGRAEIEAAGRRDYQAVFGSAISSRHFWRIFDRVTEKDGGAGNFGELGIYLPGRLTRKSADLAFERYAQELPSLAVAVHGVQNPDRLTNTESLLLWDAACTEWQRLVDSEISERRASRRLIAALDSSGLSLARSRYALARTFSRKLERWVIGGGIPAALKDMRSANPGRLPAASLSDEDRKLLIAHSLKKGSTARAWREANQEGLLSSGVTQAYLANPANKSYVPESISRVIIPKVELVRPIFLGPRQAKLNGAYITRDWSKVLPGDWYQADDTTPPVYFWEEGENGRPRLLRGQLLVMVDCRTNRVLAFALHPDRNYTAAVIRGLILRTHDSYGLPKCGFHFENGIWKSSKLLRGTTEMIGDGVDLSDTELGLRDYGVNFTHALPGNARSKVVERIIGLLQNRMEDLPGYVGRNEMTEKHERVQSQKLMVERGAADPSRYFFHRDQWVSRLTELCESYNNEIQQGRLNGQSPCEAWDTLFDHAKPLVKLGPDTRYILANHRRPLKVTRNGICIQIGKIRRWFRNELTGNMVGETVQAYFDPEDLSSIFVKQAINDNTAIVVEAEITVPAMSATSDELAEAQRSVTAQNSAARTLYSEIAPYFPDNRPSPFRRVMADEDTIIAGREIAAQQEAIKATQRTRVTVDRKANRLRRELGADARIPLARLEVAEQLKKEIEANAYQAPRI